MGAVREALAILVQHRLFAQPPPVSHLDGEQFAQQGRAKLVGDLPEVVLDPRPLPAPPRLLDEDANLVYALLHFEGQGVTSRRRTARHGLPSLMAGGVWTGRCAAARTGAPTGTPREVTAVPRWE